jgi:integrase
MPKSSPAPRSLWPTAAPAAYSGCRIDELAELRVTDVTEDRIVVRIGKNENAVRNVPLHPTLLPVVQVLQQNAVDEFLIPGLLRGGRDNKRSHVVSKSFGRLIGKMDFPLELNFHGLRRSTHNRLLSASVTRELADWLTGHDDQSEMFTLYAERPHGRLCRQRSGRSATARRSISSSPNERPSVT